MTRDAQKPRQVRIYLNADNEEKLRLLGENIPGLSEAQIATLLVSAALKACADQGYRLHLPLQFKIADEPKEDFRLNEPAPKPKRRS